MSTVLRDPPDLAGAGSGIVARRAVFRWGWRLFRREWRQQLLVLGLLAMAVAATIWGASVVTNVRLPNPNWATYGTAAAQVTLPGSDPHLAADIASIQRRWGPADVIENQNIATGTTQSVQLRAESPHGHFNSPLLGLVSGTYPAGPGQVALTSQVATLYGTHMGGSWRAAGTTWRVTGIVQDPSNLSDEFALVTPGQVPHPSQVIMLLGPAAARLANSNVTLPGVPAATLSVPAANEGGLPQATLVLVVEVLGLAFIGLVSVASFSVMAQRRLRALGMLSAIGATERNLRLVMIVNGLVVGVAAALAGAAAGLAAWFAYVPTLQQATGHVVDAASLPWWAFAIGVVLAIATSVLASRRPAKTMAAVPVVAALSGRPAPPRAVHRSALPGVIVFAVGLVCLAFTGGLAGPPGGGRGPGSALPLLAGLVGVIAGIILLAPLAISVLTAGAGPRLPVAIRIALRDLVRYRARSGAALAAVTFAVFLAAVICLVGSERTDNPLSPSGPNLSSSQLVVTSGRSPAPGMMMPLSSAQVASLSRRLNSLAASLHARSALPLESAAMLYQAGTPVHNNFSGSGWDHPGEAIGPAPPRGNAEAWAQWHSAFVVMARVEGIDVRHLTDGQLLARRRAYEAETSWAPKHVAEELRAARKQEQYSKVEATRHTYEAAAAAGHGRHEQAALHEHAARSWAALGQRATLVREKLTEAHDTCCQWEAMTEPTRRLGRAADIELKRRGVLGPDDRLRSAEPEGFKYEQREKTADVWIQPRLDGTADLPREPEPEPLAAAAREERALQILGLTFGYDQPELPLQVTEIAEYNRKRQAEIDERRSMRVPSEDPDEVDLGEAWNILAERRRDAVIQPPKPPIPAAEAVLERTAEHEAE